MALTYALVRKKSLSSQQKRTNRSAKVPLSPSGHCSNYLSRGISRIRRHRPVLRVTTVEVVTILMLRAVRGHNLYTVMFIMLHDLFCEGHSYLNAVPGSWSRLSLSELGCCINILFIILFPVVREAYLPCFGTWLSPEDPPSGSFNELLHDTSIVCMLNQDPYLPDCEKRHYPIPQPFLRSRGRWFCFSHLLFVYLLLCLLLYQVVHSLSLLQGFSLPKFFDFL